MDSVTLSDFQKDLSRILDRVNDDHTPLLVTRPDGKPAVVMSVEDFQSFEETAYLLASPANAERLSQSVADVESGRTLDHDLIDE